MWTDQEQAIAKTLVEPETLALIEKVFITVSPSLNEALEKNIVALDDAEYGRLMKIKYLSGKENEYRINLLKKLARPTSEGKDKTAIAPR